MKFDTDIQDPQRRNPSDPGGCLTFCLPNNYYKDFCESGKGYTLTCSSFRVLPFFKKLGGQYPRIHFKKQLVKAT